PRRRTRRGTGRRRRAPRPGPALEPRADGDRRDNVDALAAGRPGAGEHELAHELRLVLRDHLRDEAAQREAEQVDLIEAQRADDADGVARHRGDGRRGPPFEAPMPRLSKAITR